LEVLIEMISSITARFALVFPIHPRTVNRLKEFGLWEKLEKLDRLIFCEPLDYFSFQKLTAECKFVVTDSGGIQEETTFRKIPCLTLRNNTERPSTITIGSNILVPYNAKDLDIHIQDIIHGRFKQGSIPPLWDGKSTERILDILSGL
jgi:UDP-N-acetylglucosamine 2-epimerase (non-hydrolysing)